MLMQNARQIAHQFGDFWRILTSPHQLTICISSGEKVAALGMPRFHLIEIIEKVLSLNEIEELGVNFNECDLFSAIEVSGV